MKDKQLESITAGELMDKRLVNNPFIIPGLLPTGTYILAGAPKVGKSFLMAQLCWCVSEGQPFLSQPVNRCETLYLVLEDTQPRLQERLGRMFGVEWAGTGFHLVFQAEMKGDALLQQLDAFLFEHPDIQLVVIDTLQRVREYHGSQYSYSNDYEDIRPFKEYTDTHELALILVHHTRKDETGSPFDRISGTNGLLGAADGAFLLYSDKSGAVLDFVGRDLPSQRYELNFDQERCLWELTQAVAPTPRERPEPLLDIVDQIIEQDWCGTPTDFARLVNETAQQMGVSPKGGAEPVEKIAPNILTRRLNALANRLEKEKGVLYMLPGRGESRRYFFRRTENSHNQLHDGSDDTDGSSPMGEDTDETDGTDEREDNHEL